MSDHWRPDEDVARARFGGREQVRSPGEAVPAELGGPTVRDRVPEGAKPGLLVVAALSLCVGLAVYGVLGPRQVVAPGAEKHLVEIGRGDLPLTRR